MIKLQQIVINDLDKNVDNRICVANKELSLRPITKKQTIGFKPIGLWYAFGKEWLKYLNTVLKEPAGKFIYKFDIDKCKMVYLNSEYRIHTFTQKYGVKEESEESRKYGTVEDMIDWSKVANDYEGVEFDPYFKDLEKVYQWYETVSIPSGCIWDSRNLKITKIDSLKETTFPQNIDQTGIMARTID